MPAYLVRNLLKPWQEGNAALEGGVVIYMDDYRKAQAMSVASHRRYDDEVLCVNWNPAIHGLAASWYQTSGELSPELPEDLSTMDVDAFLSRVYALATQV